MKKIIIVVMLVSVLSACGNNNLKSNTIADAELTDREKEILLTTSDQSFVFDFQVDSDFKETSVWIEKYELGKLVNEQIGYISTEVTDNGSIIFTADKSNTTQNETFFNISINSKGNTGSTASSELVSDKGTEGLAIVWGSNNEDMDVTEGELALGSICYSFEGNGMSSLSSDFYKDAEGHINEIENYDVVYLLKSQFTK